MPKRKLSDDGYDRIERKIKKLERKLKRARRRKKRSSSSSSRDSTTVFENSKEKDKCEIRTTCSSLIDEIISCDPITENDVSNLHPVNEHTENSALPSTSNTNSTNHVSDANTQNESNNLTVATTPEETLDKDILDILGADPSSIVEYGKDIHKELANRFEHIATTGLEKEVRKELSTSYLIPANCKRIGAPLLNLEIKAALSEITLKRDKGMEARQKQIATAISCLGEAITLQLQTSDKNHVLLKHLMDASRILCDVQHTDSMKRRYFAFSSLKKDVNDQLLQTKIDKYLFGENLAETLKAAKAVSKSGAEIKVAYNNINKNYKKPTQPQPSTSKSLNWKPPVPSSSMTRRQSGTQRSRQPASTRMQHDNSSKTSRHQSKQTRRR